jgi:hypothetical protein
MYKKGEKDIRPGLSLVPNGVINHPQNEERRGDKYWFDYDRPSTEFLN